MTARITPASTVTRGGQTEGNVQEERIHKPETIRTTYLTIRQIASIE